MAVPENSLVRFVSTWDREITAYSNNRLVCGKLGVGKTTTCENLLMNFYESGSKCINLIDQNGRLEGACYAFAEDRPKMLRLLEKHNLSPKWYPTQVIFLSGKFIDSPAFRNFPNIPQERGEWVVRSIRESDIPLEIAKHMFATSVGTTGPKAALARAISNLKKFSFEGLINELHSLDDVNVNTRSSLVSNIRRWQSSGMFDERFEPLDLLEVLKDNSRITVFSTMMLDTEDYKDTFHALFFRLLSDFVRTRQFRGKAQIYCPEAQELKELAVYYLVEMLKAGRDQGMGVIFDIHQYMSLTKLLRELIPVAFLHNQDYASAKPLFEDKAPDVPPVIRRSVTTLGRGVAHVIDQKMYHPFFQFPTTRHRHKEEGVDMFHFAKKRFGVKKLVHKKLGILREIQKDPFGYFVDSFIEPSVGVVYSCDIDVNGELVELDEVAVYTPGILKSELREVFLGWMASKKIVRKVSDKAIKNKLKARILNVKSKRESTGQRRTLWEGIQFNPAAKKLLKL